MWRNRITPPDGYIIAGIFAILAILVNAAGQVAAIILKAKGL